jgi:antitoxin component YwqK of YwqJK toxin-antitoxin module
MGIFDILKKNKNEDPKNGIRKSYYDNGKGPLEYTVNVINGYWDGIVVYYRRDGSISSTRTYVNDLYDRDRLLNHSLKNNDLGTSRSNVMFGEGTDRYANGNIEIISNKQFTSSGGAYEFGIWQHFDINGKLLYVEDYGNPIPCEFSNKKYFDDKIKEIESQRKEFKDLLQIKK